MSTDQPEPAVPVRMIGGPVQVFDDPDLLPADVDSLQAVQSMVRGTDLVAPPVVLPDFHHKSKMELPSSVAVATRDTVRPDLTSSSVNCGMALIALGSEVPDDRAIDAFMRAVRERFPYPTRGHAADRRTAPTRSRHQ